MVLAATSICSVLTLAPTIYMLQVYDRVMVSYSIETLVLLSGLVIAVYASQSGFEWIRARLLVRAGVEMDEQYAEEIYFAAFELNKQSDRPYSVGQAITDFTSVRQFATGGGLIMFLEVPWAPFYLIVITIFHPLLGVFSFLSATILLGLTYANESRTKVALESANRAAIEATRFSNQQFLYADAIHAMGMLGNLRRLWQEKYKEIARWQTNASDKAADITAVSKAYRYTSQSIVLGLGAYLAIKGEVSGGMIIAGSVLMGRALAPVEALIQNWKNYSAAKSAWGRLSQLIGDTPKRKIPRLQLPQLTGRIQVNGLSVLGSNKAPILQDVSFEIDAGDFLVIAGPSGSGKSTLVRSLLGLVPTVRGEVRYDGAELSTIDENQFASHIGYRSQMADIFEGTVAQNVARMGEIDDDAVVSAAQMLGAHEMILSLPNSYQTRIGDGGEVPLSVGQRQKIALSRAFYHSPTIMFLDEPDTALDEFSERRLESALKQAHSDGRTLVVISHKKNLLALSTHFLLLREGRVASFGKTKEILRSLINASQ
jgi:ATP-binding cassette subfamily C exporter for protease/lipase